MSNKTPGQIAFEVFMEESFKSCPRLAPSWSEVQPGVRRNWERVGEAFTSIRPSVDEQTDDSSGVTTVTND